MKNELQIIIDKYGFDEVLDTLKEMAEDLYKPQEFKPEEYSLTQTKTFDWRTSELKGTDLARAVLDSFKK